VSDTVVFIPAWNEEENLPAVLDDLTRELPDADVLVVDDGSTDRTAEIALARGAEVLSLGTNRGLPIGIAAGYRWALAVRAGAAIRNRARGRLRRRGRFALRLG